ncbi:MAG: VOC family protein [Bacteroidota bacterium]|nr:VOC family protein [Bacteroidota bacterium]
MKLQHIAFSVSNIDEVEKFYADILEMKKLKSFVLKKELAHKIFNINEDTAVFLMGKEELTFEIFVSNQKVEKGFAHICISVKDREKLIEKVEAQKYECIRIERDNFDLIFIKDKNGNIFEIKEIR